MQLLHNTANQNIKKHGTQNNIQRYKCNICNKTFTFQKKLNPSDIWKDYRRLHYWYLKHQDYLNERSEKSNERGYFPYKHKGLRGAYASLKYYEKYLFAFEKYPELNIEKTTNRLEGLFSELKRKLINHNGLTKRRKIMFIKDFLNKKSC